MIDKIVEFLLKIFGSKEIITLIISMFPLIELKGAIPIGLKLGNSLFSSFILSYVGSTFVFFIIFFLLIPIFSLLKKIKFVNRIIEKIELIIDEKAKKIANKNSSESEKEKNKFLKKSLFLFVAVPFPITGVYMGTAISVFLNMKFKDSILPIALGNLVSGSIILLLTWLFKDYVDIIIYTLFIIALIMLVIFIFKILKKKKQTE